MSLFIIFGAMALGSGLGMLFSRNAVHAALLLVVNLGSIAGLFLTLGAEFLFAAQIIVYAGAIMVLFLFVIMLLGVDRAESLVQPPKLQKQQAFWALIAGVPIAFGLFATLLVPALTAPSNPLPKGFGSPESLGQTLFSTYLLPFEVTSLLLLVAAIGVLMLAKRRTP